MIPAGRSLGFVLVVLAAGCATVPPEPPGRDDRPVQAGGSSGRCLPATVTLPLLGRPGDSPILPVRIGGRDAAMFFSPGFGPILFRNNGAVRFQHYRPARVQLPDGGISRSYTSKVPDLSVGALPLATRDGFLLPEPEDRAVEGRPIVGVLGRAVLPRNARLVLDGPARRMEVGIPCPDVPRTVLAGSIPMQWDWLLVTVSINGRTLAAILDPDLPTSILPAAAAAELGIAIDPSAPTVVTRFSHGVIGRRQRVRELLIGAVALHGVVFDIEDGVSAPILGLNVLAQGRATFAFGDGRFLFERTADAPPPATSLHFDRTRVARVAVGEGR